MFQYLSVQIPGTDMQAAVTHLLLLGALCLNFRVQASTQREVAGTAAHQVPHVGQSASKLCHHSSSLTRLCTQQACICE